MNFTPEELCSYQLIDMRLDAGCFYIFFVCFDSLFKDWKY